MVGSLESLVDRWSLLLSNIFKMIFACEREIPTIEKTEKLRQSSLVTLSLLLVHSTVILKFMHYGNHNSIW